MTLTLFIYDMQNLIPTPVLCKCAAKGLKLSLSLPPNTLHSSTPGSSISASLISLAYKTEMGSYFSHSFTKEQLEMALVKAKAVVNSNPVVVFSKTYCGYCKRVKQLLTQLGARYKVVELDGEADGGELQEALGEWTGHKTVPNVFIGGKHIGGCDAVLEKHQSGQLLLLLKEAGAVASNPVSA